MVVCISFVQLLGGRFSVGGGVLYYTTIIAISPLMVFSKNVSRVGDQFREQHIRLDGNSILHQVHIVVDSHIQRIVLATEETTVG